MILSLRLMWKRWRLRHQQVPASAGVTLTRRELDALRYAEWAWRDKEATRKLAGFEEGAELLAAAENGDWLC